ncbi:MAG TPA: winged helix-turn-helix transcriptional regulator [Methanomassiliicoccales archaeon]|nr:winged helix-turn-helix transcriptional regulator [Methanomassiliicoccales archaeon]
MDLDETDVNILRVLQQNGRLSFRQIADRVKVSVPTVSSKIAVMEQAGVIRGYTVFLDTERVGEMSVIVTVKARPSELKHVGERLKASEYVRQAFVTSNSRLMLVCTFPEAHLVNDFVSSLGEMQEVYDYDAVSLIQVLREDQRALVTPGITVVLQCAYCKKEMRGEGVRARIDGKDYHLCCNTCLKEFQEKYDRLRATP